jgi:hypothetical protein
MDRTTSIVAVVVWASLVVATAAGNEVRTPAPEPGPENSGLRLRLAVTPDARADSKTINLELVNTGPKSVTLVGEWNYREDKGDYAAFFEKRVAFLTYPEVQPQSFQTEGGTRSVPQPEHELAPGKSLVVSWKTEGNQIRRESPFPGTTPVFPSAGLYGVRATIVILTKEGSRFLLASNEQPMMVGGVRTLPKYATGRVVSADPDKNLVTIDLGSDQKVEKGDAFLIHWGLQASWRLTITNVGTWFSEGSITRLHHDGHPGTPGFPPKRLLAGLEPKR